MVVRQAGFIVARVKVYKLSALRDASNSLTTFASLIVRETLISVREMVRSILLKVFDWRMPCQSILMFERPRQMAAID